MCNDTVEYLLAIRSVRERSKIVLNKVLNDQLTNFNVDVTRLEDVAEYVSRLIRRDYDDFNEIPPHGRWQHFEVGKKRLDGLIAQWRNEGADKVEQTRRLVDLFTVSVLLDAGAGTKWEYTEQDGFSIGRSEGLAIASFHMFVSGVFSSSQNKHQVDFKALKKLTVHDLQAGMQVSESNPLEGLEGRTQLLIRLGKALENETYFAEGRPGDMVDYLSQKSPIDLTDLWTVLMDGFGPIWPQGRTKLDGKSLGDAWPLSTLSPPQSIAPFHKLTQWLCYSLIVPMKKVAEMEFVNEDLQTGLPEYRNGGLFVDLGVLTLKPEVKSRGLAHGQVISGLPTFTPDDDVIVEWRASTVGLLDLLLEKVNEKLGAKLTLPQLLEAGSWKAGRELAAEKRPNTKDPPIQIISDGTVF